MAAFMRNINRLRENGKDCVNSDETWINTGQTILKESRDEDIVRLKYTFVAELTAALKHRTAGGPRFVSVRLSGTDWFIDGAKLVFLAK
jgi:hypothetical protein